MIKKRLVERRSQPVTSARCRPDIKRGSAPRQIKTGHDPLVP
jgi:hypothetical protein